MEENQNEKTKKDILRPLNNPIGKFDRNNRILAFVLIFGFIALLGIGYTLNNDLKNKNKQLIEKNNEIIELKAALETKAASEEKASDIEPVSKSAINPILEKIQSLSVQTGGRKDAATSSSTNKPSSARDRLTVTIENGAISHCYLEKAEELNSGRTTQCTVTGIDGKIYKMVERTYGKQAYLWQKILFIMENGDVYSIDGINWQEEYPATKVALGKPVVDITTSGIIRYADGSLGEFTGSQE